MKTQQYVEYYYPSLLFAETSKTKVKTRDPYEIANNLPEGCYCFRFVERLEGTCDGEEVKGEFKNSSGIYYPAGSVKMSLSDVTREMPNEKILISNMENNGYDYVVKTISGPIVPFQSDDIMLDDSLPLKGAL